jgi:hypothetical protein
MTYRERRERKAERLRAWAEKHEQKAEALYARGDPYRGDIAFNTQPGHIPERARVIAATDRSFAEHGTAVAMAGRADGIEHQLETSIYDDDPDAPERIRAKLVELEANRDHMKAVNTAIRAYEKRTGKANKELTADDLMACGCTTQDVNRMWPQLYGWRYPPYALSNLGANIRRYQQRLAALERRRAVPPS